MGGFDRKKIRVGSPNEFFGFSETKSLSELPDFLCKPAGLASQRLARTGAPGNLLASGTAFVASGAAVLVVKGLGFVGADDAVAVDVHAGELRVDLGGGFVA